MSGLLLSNTAIAQLYPLASDTFRVKQLDSIFVSGQSNSSQMSYLPEVEGVDIFSGKKTNLLTLEPGRANLANNISRMAFAQIPGINIWDMDGAGTQVNIGSRGTDAHRSIEMNMRQNGYVTNSDIFGYPENHYTVPMQAIKKIQLVRGSAALQFGSQFGGMMNYVMKEGDTSRPFSFESNQTTGSNNFLNSYNAISGKIGKLSYYAYYDYRHGDGWRQDAQFNYHAYYANLKYAFNNKGSISFQFSRMDYVQKIAGGLTDAQFHDNPKQSTRSRNYFEPEINLPAIIFKYHWRGNTSLEIITHVITGQRNSVQFINTPNIADTFNTGLGSYNPRQVDRDYYNGFTTEARLQQTYRLGRAKGIITGGLRYFNQLTKRRQKGVGTIGDDFDLSLTHDYGIDLRCHTRNYAAFAENLFQLSTRFSMTPGFRYEIINSNLDGKINNVTFPVSYTGHRTFPLFGLGLQYQANRFSQWYGNISQAYRPFLYANITPADQVGVIDPGLRDSKGYDVDLGYRGNYLNVFKFDVNLFYLYYGNHVGQLTLKNEQSNTNYLYTTNIGNSIAKGVEAYFEISILKLIFDGYAGTDIAFFNALSYDNAKYVGGSMNYAGKNVDLTGKMVEGNPTWINRAGMVARYKNFSSTIEFSYVGKSYSDANNTAFNITGATGMVPSYHLLDWAFNLDFLKSYNLSGGINNLANTPYFTRRINMYPGPGILPGDGRTFYLSVGIRL